jgi:hypothetical protein
LGNLGVLKNLPNQAPVGRIKNIKTIWQCRAQKGHISSLSCKYFNANDDTYIEKILWIYFLKEKEAHIAHAVKFKAMGRAEIIGKTINRWRTNITKHKAVQVLLLFPLKKHIPEVKKNRDPASHRSSSATLLVFEFY